MRVLSRQWDERFNWITFKVMGTVLRFPLTVLLATIFDYVSEVMKITFCILD